LLTADEGTFHGWHGSTIRFLGLFIVVRHGLGGKDRKELIVAAERMTRKVLEESHDFSLMKMFQENGVPQVIETDWVGRPKEK